jgi:DNA gyrase subunit A
MLEVDDGDELMLITRQGVINRQPVKGIRTIGRNSQGVQLVKLGPKDAVMDVARVVSEDTAPEEILTDDAPVQEITPSAALEDELGLDDADGDDDDLAPETLPEDDLDDDMDSIDELDDEL